ncbi:MAG: energy transducer TonB [Bacteroidales bacterium]|nr:energy transducer TonB [Bacteroidales bacterium]
MKRLALVFTSAVVAMLCMCAQNVSAQNAGCAKCSGQNVMLQTSNGDTTSLRVPEFDNGVYDAYAYLDEHVEYPQELEGQQAEGTCTVQFLVGADGAVSQVTVAHSSGYKEMDEEAVRVVKDFPNWKPAEINGKAVAMRTQIPVKFVYKAPKTDE